MSIPSLSSFPNTIANLPDRPNLSPERMKEALQSDVKTLWPYVQQIIVAVNNLTSRPPVYVGSNEPSDMASSLSVGDIYIYVPELPSE